MCTLEGTEQNERMIQNVGSKVRPSKRIDRSRGQENG